MRRSSSPGIFLSYRREDAAPYARLLQFQLRERFPDASIFMDLDSIEPGLDFAKVIRSAIDSSIVLIALIGRQWLTLTDENGHRRLDNPDDYVRFEIQTALERGVRVIPVLVDGARPLQQQQLPSELRRLARLNALELSYSRYEYDANRLCDLIEKVLATASGARTSSRSRRRNDPSRAVWLVADAERIAQTITNGFEKHRSLDEVATALAATDPDRAEQIARSIDDDFWRVSALVHVAMALAATDQDRAALLVADAERIAQSIPEEESSYDDTRSEIAIALAATDPDRAEHIAQGIWADDSKARTLAVIAKVRAATRPEHVVQSLPHTSYGDPNDIEFVGIATALAAADPDSAERIARSMPEGRWRVRVLAVIAMALAATDQDRAARLAADAERIIGSITKDSWRVSALADTATAWAAIDRDHATRLIADAERITQSIASEESKASALADIVGALAAINPNRALRTAQSITRDLPRVTALARAAKALAASDPDRAARLVTDAERIARSMTHGWSDVALARIVNVLAANVSGLDLG